MKKGGYSPMTIPIVIRIGFGASVQSGAFLAFIWCGFRKRTKTAPISSISHKEVHMEALKQGADALFILLGGIMVLAMHAGFAFLELGTVRRKNQVNALIKILVDFLGVHRGVFHGRLWRGL
jgi:hypothetical protein